MNSSGTGIFRVKADKSGMKIVYGKEKIQKNYPDYLRDESNTVGSDVDGLFFPKTIENIAWVLREAQENGKAVTVSGGRTGICAGAVPYGGWLLSLEKMTKMLDLKRRLGEYELKVEGGIRLSELAVMLKQKDLGLSGEIYTEFSKSKKDFFYPPDPTETTATLGGTVATNASGAKTFYYGPTRNYVVGMEVLLSSGELLRIRRGDVQEKEGFFKVLREQGSPLIIPAPTYQIPPTKHTAGFYSHPSMDLIDLFIGSEGVLGIIANITVHLLEELPGQFGGIAFFKEEEDAIAFVINAKEIKKKPLALEYFDRESLLLLDDVRKTQGTISEIPEILIQGGAVYFEFSYSSDEDLKQTLLQWETLMKDSSSDPSSAWGALTKRDLLRLKIFRHTLPESINKIISQNKRNDERIHKVGTDMAVPDEWLNEMMAFYRTVLKKEQLRYVIFGHIGNNHLHVNMIPYDYHELLRARELYMLFAQKAVSLGGTVSAEHGIGKLKKEYLRVQYPEEVTGEMKAIKVAVDPEHILNPGVVI